MEFWNLITDIGILLSVALIFGSICLKFRISPLIGYLFAGILVGGAGSLNLIKSFEQITSVAELGVCLLLFSIGLEFSWNEIKRFHSKTLLAACLQILLTPIIIILLCQLFYLPLKLSIIIGLLVTLSSTTTVLRTLEDKGELDSSYGRNSTAVLLLQDIAIVPFSIILLLLGSEDKLFDPNRILYILLGTATLIVGLQIFLNKFVLKALGFFTTRRNRDMAMLLASICGIGSAWAAHWIGLSPAIGAFIAGMILGNSVFASQIKIDIASLRAILLTLFFGSIGMLVDGLWLVNHIGLVIVITLVIFLMKTFLNTIIFITTKNSIAISVTSALCIFQIGEFAALLSNQAVDQGLVDHEFYQLIISVTMITLLMTPFAIEAAPNLGLLIQGILKNKNNNSVKKKKENQEETEEVNPEIFVFGLGPAGIEVARRLKNNKANPVIVDLNSTMEKTCQDMGLEFHLGDIRQIELFEKIKIHNAKLVIITIPSKDSILKAIENIRLLAPQAFIIVRARYQAHKPLFEEAGADIVINEEFTVGDRLAKATMHHYREMN